MYKIELCQLCEIFMKKYVSGIRPTGKIHLGNYLGAIKQWKDLDGLFFVADMHGLHTKEEVELSLKSLYSCGINAVLQSGFGVEHLRLYADLLHYATIGQLSRMTQYKDKIKKENETAALLTYPVLMAADIFFNKGTHVPVGSDQVQHIELARDLYDKLPDTPFPKPVSVIGNCPRIMSLTDATKKMSKSDKNDMSRINICDSKDLIKKKIMAAKTSANLTDNTPEISNLMSIYFALGGKLFHTKCKEFKEELIWLLIEELKSN